MRRVMIIGGPGAGKSWLAQKVGTCLGLPVVAIDDLVRGSDGARREDAAIDIDARAAASDERWVIEGGNTRTYGARLERADCVIRLKPGRLTRLWRVLRRGGVTPGLLRWTWSYDRAFGSKDDAVMTSAAGRIQCHDLRSAKAVRQFLATLPCPSGRPPSPISMGQSVV